MTRFQPNGITSVDSFARQFSEDSNTSNSLGPDIYYDAQVTYKCNESSTNSFNQEIVEGRVSDAGLGAQVNRMSIADTQNVEMISMQYTLNKPDMQFADLDHQDTLTEDSVNCIHEEKLNKMDYCDEYCDSLEVFCQKRISSTHQALEQVTICVC